MTASRGPSALAVAAFLLTLVWPGLVLTAAAVGCAGYATGGVLRAGWRWWRGQAQPAMEPRLRDVPVAALAYVALGFAGLYAFGALTGIDPYADEADLSNAAFLTRDLLDSVTLAGVSLFFLRVRYGWAAGRDGLAWRGLAPVLGMGAAVGAAVWFATLPLDTLTAWLVPDAPVDHPLTARLGVATTAADYLTVVVSGCLLAPVCEEIAFRGFLFRLLDYRLGFGLALLLANVAFAAAHGATVRLPGIFATGVLLTLLYAGSRSLPAAMAAHATINLLTFASMLVP